MAKKFFTIRAETKKDLRDVTQELKDQLDTYDGIDQAVNNIFKVEKMALAGAKSISGFNRKTKKEKVEQAKLDTEALNLGKDLVDGVKERIKGFKKLRAGARLFNITLAANPVIALGAALLFVLTLIGKINKALAETRTNLGVSAVEAALIRTRIELVGQQLKLIGLESKDAQESFDAIRKTFGGIDVASSGFVKNLAAAQLFTGATTSQIADLLAIQESVTSASRETLLAQLKTVSASIRLEGVAPDAVFRELAENAEAVALNINDGGDNLIRAAIQARKLGVEFKTVTGIADKLLNFESSIESQLEASVLLGREINLDRARQLALNNDLAGALEEVVTQVGGEAEFNELNRIQRQALADSVGVSVQELSRLVRDNANAGTTGVAQAAMTQEEVSKGILAATIDVVKNTERGGKASETVARFVSE